MYRIKQLPEDFIVKEESAVQAGKEGRYSYFMLKKRNYTTIRALEQIARILRKPLKMFGFAGNKDKVAVTEQVCSVFGIGKKRLESIKIRDIELVYLGSGDKPVSLGDLSGNRFEIIVRNITKKPMLKNRFINYFGEQRFGRNNAETGRAIVKRDFKAAAGLIDNCRASDFLDKNPNNYVGAIRTLPLKQLKIYVHAYQSLLWNRLAEASECVHSILKSKFNFEDAMHMPSGKEPIPLIGFGTEETKEVGEILKSEGISRRDFIIKQMPELSSEGTERECYAVAEELETGELEDDELNNGMKKVKLKFRLKKGCYATEFIRQNVIDA